MLNLKITPSQLNNCRMLLHECRQTFPHLQWPHSHSHETSKDIVSRAILVYWFSPGNYYCPLYTCSCITETCYNLDRVTRGGWWFHFRRSGGGWSRRVPQHWIFLQSCVFRITKNTHLKLIYLGENFTDWRGGLVVWIGLLKIFSSHQVNP